MKAIEYLPLARKTLKVLPYFEHMRHMSLGLVGEMGELIDALKKVAIYGKEVDFVNNREEVGDLSWYGINLLPELGVDPMIYQRSLDIGYQQGLAEQKVDPMMLAGYFLQLSNGLATVCVTMSHPPELAPGSSNAVASVESIAGVIGTVAGLLRVEPGEAMEINIAKLAKRYPDKFDASAALNRDLDAERKVLEGTPRDQGIVAG